MSTPPEEAAPDPREAELLRWLRAAQLLLLKYPVAARAAAQAFAEEGRRFAETPQGAAWRQALAESPLMRRGRTVFETLSLNMAEERREVLLPSMVFETLMAAAAVSNLEGLLMQLFTRGSGDAAP